MIPMRNGNARNAKALPCSGTISARNGLWEVDECPQCGGYWLDAGELALIRQEYESEQERKKAVDRYFAEVAASQLASMRAGGRDQAERARKLDALFRFSSPIRYQVNPG